MRAPAAWPQAWPDRRRGRGYRPSRHRPRFPPFGIADARRVGLLLVMVWLDGRARVRSLPRGSGWMGEIPGAGFATMFLLTVASMGFAIYGPAILQTLSGLSAPDGGLCGRRRVGMDRPRAQRRAPTGAWPVRMIRLGAIVATLGVALSALTFPATSVAGVVIAGVFLGGGFGLSWAFMSQRILASLEGEERAIGAAAMTTVRLTGSAVGQRRLARSPISQDFRVVFRRPARARPGCGCSPRSFQWRWWECGRPGN